MIGKIKRGIKNPLWIIERLKSKIVNYLLVDLLYSSREEYKIKFKNVEVKYSTTDKHSRSWFFPRYSTGNIHEANTTKLIINMLNKSDIFVDIGAHLGFFTCIAGKIVTEGRVYAFDIDKKVLSLLKKNVELNNLNNVITYNYAISNKEKIIRMPKKDKPNAGLRLIKGKENEGENLYVKAISLDGFFNEKEITPDVIKIDVEGAELSVLKGMESLLKKENLILFLEIHGRLLTKSNLKEIFSFLRERGYKIYKIKNYHSENKSDNIKLKKMSNGDMLRVNSNTMCYVTKG